MIELGIYKCDGDNVTFHISKQDHIESDFYNDTNAFLASNGIALQSVAYPEWDLSNKTFYVRGYNNLRYDMHMQVTKEEYKLICEAVNEYNATFGTDDIRSLFEL